MSQQEPRLHRRLGDDISPGNERVYDAARALTVALRLVDQLGLEILSARADAYGVQRVHIVGDTRGLLNGRLEGETPSGDRHYIAQRYGVDIVWVELAVSAQAAAL